MDIYDRMFLSILASISMAFIFSFYSLFIDPYISSKGLSLIIEFLIFSSPFFFIFTSVYDGFIGLFSGITYMSFKHIILNLLSISEFCPIPIIIFGIAFSIFSVSIGFQKEASMKSARISGAGIAVTLLGFIFSSLMLIAYHYSYSIDCIDIRSVIFKIIYLLSSF